MSMARFSQGGVTLDGLRLDIAGPAFLDRSRGDYLWQPGGSGYGVRLIAELASRLTR